MTPRLVEPTSVITQSRGAGGEDGVDGLAEDAQRDGDHGDLGAVERLLEGAEPIDRTRRLGPAGRPRAHGRGPAAGGHRDRPAHEADAYDGNAHQVAGRPRACVRGVVRAPLGAARDGRPIAALSPPSRVAPSG